MKVPGAELPSWLTSAQGDLDPHLQGHQFGVGTYEGATAMLMHTKSHLARFQEHVDIQLDFKNVSTVNFQQNPLCPLWLGQKRHQIMFRKCLMCLLRF